MQHFSVYWFLPLGILFIGIIFCYLNNKKWPPYIEKNFDSSCYIVNVVTFVKYGHCSYMEYAFVKKKNGKYKLKYNVFDLITTIISFVVMGGIYSYIIIQVVKLMAESFSMVSIIFCFVSLLVILGFLVLLHFPKIVARVYFRKHFKEIDLQENQPD